MTLIPCLTTMDGKDREGEDRDTDEFEDDNNEGCDDDEDDYGDEQDFEAEGAKARNLDLNKIGEGAEPILDDVAAGEDGGKD